MNKTFLRPGDTYGALLDMKNGTHAEVVVAPPAAVAANGDLIPLASLAQSLAYNPDGTLASVSVTHAGTTYRQSLTYTAGKLTAVSAWEAQP